MSGRVLRERAGVRAIAGLSVALVALSGCSGGSGSDAGAGSSGSTSPSAAPRPPVATLAQATKVMKDFQRRNDAGLRKIRKPPHAMSVWRGIDTGSALAADRYDAVAYKAGYRAPRWKIVLGPVTRLYAPTTTAGQPQWFAAVTKVRMTRRSDKWKGSELLLFERTSASGKWAHLLDIAAKHPRLPKALAPGEPSSVTQAERRRPVTLVERLAKAWSRGRTPHGFKKSKLLSSGFWVRAGQSVDVDASVVVPEVRVVRVAGGVLALAPIKVRTTYHMASGNQAWSGEDAYVWGRASRATLSSQNIADVAIMVPDHGEARVVGRDISSAKW